MLFPRRLERIVARLEVVGLKVRRVTDGVLARDLILALRKLPHKVLAALEPPPPAGDALGLGRLQLAAVRRQVERRARPAMRAHELVARVRVVARVGRSGCVAAGTWYQNRPGC